MEIFPLSILNLKYLPTQIYIACTIIRTEEISQRGNQSMKMIRSKVCRGSRYNTCIFLLSNALVVCCEQIVKAERISSDVLQMSIREYRVRSAEKRIGRTKKDETGARKEETEIVVHAYDRRDWSGRSIKRESVVRESFCCYRGLRPRRWLFTRDRLLLPVRRIGVPCYRVMSLLFKNHARVTCAAINYNNVI